MDNRHKASLVPLVLGNAKAVTDTSINAMRDHIESAVPGIEAIDALDQTGRFISRSCAVKIGPLAVSAHSHFPVRTMRKDSQHNYALCFPISGTIDFDIGSKSLVAKPGASAVFLSGGARSVRTGTVSNLMIGLNRNKLENTAQSMFGGAESGKVDLRLLVDREIPLTGPCLAASDYCQKIFSLIDCMNLDQSMIGAMNLGDTLYRNFTIMLAPELFKKATTQQLSVAARDQAQDKVDSVCEYIQANLDMPLTLSDLEQFSGLTARALQYSFLNRFGCSPLQWVREQRLCRVHNLLLLGAPSTKISDVVFACGFTHLGAFSQHYLRRFGETPSETLKRNK